MKKKAKLVGDSVVAGFPSPAEQYADTPLDLNELLVRNVPATFFVRVAGDSMEDAGICNGDLLVVDRSLDAADGDIVIACVENEFTVKYLRKSSEGIWLEPANKKYERINFSGEMSLKIFGVATALIRKFKR